MSKRLKNYPDPMHVVNAYGADALRLYLIDSPVVKGDPLRFREAGVLSVVKDIFLPWYNAMLFYAQNADRLTKALEGGDVEGPVATSVPGLDVTGRKAFQADPDAVARSTNAMDRWIVAATHGLIR